MSTASGQAPTAIPSPPGLPASCRNCRWRCRRPRSAGLPGRQCGIRQRAKWWRATGFTGWAHRFHRGTRGGPRAQSARPERGHRPVSARAQAAWRGKGRLFPAPQRPEGSTAAAGSPADKAEAGEQHGPGFGLRNGCHDCARKGAASKPGRAGRGRNVCIECIPVCIEAADRQAEGHIVELVCSWRGAARGWREGYSRKLC